MGHSTWWGAPSPPSASSKEIRNKPQCLQNMRHLSSRKPGSACAGVNVAFQRRLKCKRAESHPNKLEGLPSRQISTRKDHSRIVGAWCSTAGGAGASNREPGRTVGKLNVVKLLDQTRRDEGRNSLPKNRATLIARIATSCLSRCLLACGKQLLKLLLLLRLECIELLESQNDMSGRADTLH